MSGDEERWQEVRRRRESNTSNTRVHQRFNNPAITSFFIYNLPEGISDTTFRNLFTNINGMVDSYLARKKDRRGNLFGFVRFKKVNNINNLLLNLNSIKVDGAVLGAKVAKYPKCVEVASKGRPVPSSRFTHRSSDTTLTSNGAPPPTNHVGSGSYLGALLNKEQISKVMIPHALMPISSGWSNLSIMGTLKDVQSLNSVVDLLNGIGLVNADVRYIGGLNVLISFFGSSLARNSFENHRSQLDAIFSHVELWFGSPVVSDRIASINIYGVPLHLWDPTVFNLIGEVFGKVVLPSSASSMDGNLSYDRILVLTPRKLKIREEIMIVWRGSSFPIAVAEDMDDWSPGFCTSSSKSSSVHLHGLCESALDPAVVHPVKNPDINSSSSLRSGLLVHVGGISDGSPARNNVSDFPQEREEGEIFEEDNCLGQPVLGNDDHAGAIACNVTGVSSPCPSLHIPGPTPLVVDIETRDINNIVEDDICLSDAMRMHGKDHQVKSLTEPDDKLSPDYSNLISKSSVGPSLLSGILASPGILEFDCRPPPFVGSSSMHVGPGSHYSSRPKKRLREDLNSDVTAGPSKDLLFDIFGPDPPGFNLPPAPPPALPSRKSRSRINHSSSSKSGVSSDASGPPPIIDVEPHQFVSGLSPSSPVSHQDHDVATEIADTIATGECVGIFLANYQTQLKEVMRCEGEI